MRRETIHTEDGRTIHLIFVDAAELEEDRLIRREFALAPPVHPCETGEMHAPCHGLQDLFFATEAEIKQGLVLAPHEYAPAIQLCATCPMRAECAAEGIKYDDRHTVRAGLRLWVRLEREQLTHQAGGTQ